MDNYKESDQNSMLALIWSGQWKKSVTFGAILIWKKYCFLLYSYVRNNFCMFFFYPFMFVLICTDQNKFEFQKALLVHQPFRCTWHWNFLLFLKTWDLKCCFYTAKFHFHQVCSVNVYCDATAGWRKQCSQLSHCCSSHVNVFILQPRLITALLCWWPLGLEPLEPTGLSAPDSSSCPTN